MEAPLPLGQISICARSEKSLWYDSGAFFHVEPWNTRIVFGTIISSTKPYDGGLYSGHKLLPSSLSRYHILLCYDPTFDPFYSSSNYRTEHSNPCGSCYHHFSNIVSLPKNVGQQPMLTQPVQLEHNSTQQINYLSGIQHREPVDPLTIT